MHEFTCAACGKTQLSDTTDEELNAGMVSDFGPESLSEDRVSVCNDCYLFMTTLYSTQDFIEGKPPWWMSESN